MGMDVAFLGNHILERLIHCGKGAAGVAPFFGLGGEISKIKKHITGNQEIKMGYWRRLTCILLLFSTIASGLSFAVEGFISTEWAHIELGAVIMARMAIQKLHKL